jgi:hypothetical protein
LLYSGFNPVLTEGGEYFPRGGPGKPLSAQQVVGKSAGQHGEHILAEVRQAGQQPVLQQDQKRSDICEI